MSNLKTISLIAAEIEKLHAKITVDNELERLRVDLILQQIEHRIRNLEENTSGANKEEGNSPLA